MLHIVIILVTHTAFIFRVEDRCSASIDMLIHSNILLHIAIMQKTKYGVNPQSTVCARVIIVVAVLDPFCLQKELKLRRWDGVHLHGPSTEFTEINKLVCKILIST